MLTCGLHIHVAVAGGDRALAVHNALRSYLPELAALSANSPYRGGRHTGIASTRLQLNRSLVRHGVPPVFESWDAYAAFVEWGFTGGSIPDPSYHWWDLRLHPGFGTIEIRVCDTQTEIADTVALVALAQALVAWLEARYDAGPAYESAYCRKRWLPCARTERSRAGCSCSGSSATPSTSPSDPESEPPCEQRRHA